MRTKFFFPFRGKRDPVSAERNDVALEVYLNTFEEWIAPTLLNSWVNYGTTLQDARYRRDTAGIVHIQGLVKSGSSASAVIMTLPVGYRPAAILMFATPVSGGVCDMRVNTSGSVWAANGGSTVATSISFSFVAEEVV